MKKILVIGATGTIGSAVCKTFKNAGYDTIETSRNSSINIDIYQTESVKSYFKNNSDFDAIICTAGQASFGSLDKLDEEAFKSSFNSKLMGQIRIVQLGLDSLNPGGVILLTGGMLAYEPWPETSAIATVNAGLEGFIKAASKELSDNKKVYIVHPPLVAETASSMGMDASPWPSAAKVGEIYLKGVEGKISREVIFLDGYEPRS